MKIKSRLLASGNQKYPSFNQTKDSNVFYFLNSVIRGKKNRKSAFENYCVQIINEKKKETEEKKVEALQMFEKLLESMGTESTWTSIQEELSNSELSKYHDMKECEKRFKQRLKILIDEEEESKKIIDQTGKRKEKRKIFEDFMQLLEETKEITAKTTWKQVKKMIDKDPRYLAVTMWKEREDMFLQYLRKVKGEIENVAFSELTEREKRELESLKKRREEEEQARVAKIESEFGKRKDNIKDCTLYYSLLSDLVKTHQVSRF